MDNFDAIAQNLIKNVEDYELGKDGMSPYDAVLHALQRPYGDMTNYGKVIDVMKSCFSPEAARAWFAYPDYTVSADARNAETAAKFMDSDIAGRAGELTEELVRSNMLVSKQCPDGSPGYLRNYLFGLLNRANYYPDKDPFAEVAAEWWMSLVNGGSKDLRSQRTPYRIIPHEGVLDGSAAHGRIPMGIEIPDQRQVLPMDSLDQIIDSRYRIAVMDCICRSMQERTGERKCDHPVEDTCIAFNQLAEAVIEQGFAKEITAKQAKDIVRMCRDRGLAQEIGDAVNPLAVCNCCECCCLCLKSMNRFETTIASPSRWQADAAHTDRCVGCGTCAEICPAHAVSFEDGAPYVNAGLCIGCGECAALCPEGVIRMIKRTGAPDACAIETPDRIYI